VRNVKKGTWVTKKATRSRQTYSSPLISQRRHRILAEAQALIVARGEGGFTIRELSKRAKVAQRTLYNAFGDKESIIARAIEEHYAELFQEPTYRHKSVTAKSVLQNLEKSVRDIMATREYARSMVAVYFSPRANEKIYLALKHVAATGVRNWLDAARRKNWIEEWYPVESMTDRYANAFMATIHDWLIGRIADEDLPRHIKTVFLLVILGASRSAQRTEITKLLNGLSSSKGRGTARRKS
jgi:AcrR family transcriptional regulator